MHQIPFVATLLVVLTNQASAESIAATSISNAQASALQAPLASYIARVEASPSFAQVVAEIAKATAHPDSALGNGAPAAENFPAFAAELNAVAAKDQSVLGGLPADAQAFLANAANGEIAVINSVLAESGKQANSAGSMAGSSYMLGSTAGAASARPAMTSSSATLASVSLRPTGSAGGNMSSPNASTVAAPNPSQSKSPGQHVASGSASVTATNAGLLAFVAALWLGMA